jgi:integrase
LGSLSDFNLVEAREKARKCRQLLRDGIDPIEANKATAGHPFEDVAQLYHDDHSQKWSNPKARAQFLSTLRTYAFKKLGKVDVANITTKMVLDVLKAPVEAKGKLAAGPLYLARPETCARLIQRIRWTLDFAAVHQYRSGENPARRELIAAGLPRPTRSVKHFASMPYQDVPEFVSKLRERDGIAPRALEFTILTACRTSECLGAKWPEMDFDNRLWTVPGSRTKTRTELKVPLASSAVALLKDLPREEGNDHVFIGPINDRLSNMALAAVMEIMGIDNATPHGFRSSFRNFAEDRTSYPDPVKELCLGHKVGTKVERAYRRTDLLAKRRGLMADWADYLDGNVIRLAATVD